MKESQFYMYLGISASVFEDICDEVRKSIDDVLSRRGLNGIENIEFRDISTGVTTATPLINNYLAYISTELNSSLASANGKSSEIHRTPIDPLGVFQLIKKEAESLIIIRNKLFHAVWSPELLNTDRAFVKGFRKKVTNKGSDIEITIFDEHNFIDFIRRCENLKKFISALNVCLDKPSQFSLDRFFKFEDNALSLINDSNTDKCSVLTRMKENLKKLS